MPSSPEVWPHESPIAPDELGKGRPEGTPKGTATAVMALNASGGVREGGRSPARVSVSARRPPTAPRPGRGDTARPPAEGRLSLSPHTLSVPRLSGDRGGHRYVEGAGATPNERARPGRPQAPRRARVPLLEAATPATGPALRPQARPVPRRPPAGSAYLRRSVLLRSFLAAH